MDSTKQRYPVTGKEGAEIDLKTAATWTSNYRQRNPGETISHLFGEEILHRILNQQECIGIRIYYANSEQLTSWQRFVLSISNFLKKAVGAQGVPHLILVGVTKDGMDQLPDGQAPKPTPIEAPQNTELAIAFTAASSSNILAEQAMPCPGSPGCPKNPLTGQS